MFLPYLQIIKLNYYHSGKSEKVVSLSFGCSHLVCAAPRVWRADGVSNPNYRGRSWCGQASHQPGSRGARGQGQPIPGDYRHNKVCFRQCCVASFFVSPLASGVKAAFKISSKKQPNKLTVQYFCSLTSTGIFSKTLLKLFLSSQELVLIFCLFKI